MTDTRIIGLIISDATQERKRWKGNAPVIITAVSARRLFVINQRLQEVSHKAEFLGHYEVCWFIPLGRQFSLNVQHIDPFFPAMQSCHSYNLDPEVGKWRLPLCTAALAEIEQRM